MKLKNLFSSNVLIVLLFLFAAAFSPPETKAQAFIEFDTLKISDSAHTISIAPYGDDVQITFIDSSNSRIDTFKIYEELPGYGAFKLAEFKHNADGGYDSTGVIVPGDGKTKTFTLVNRQPFRIKIVRTNDSAYTSIKSYYIVTARTKYYNSIPGSFKTETAYVGYYPERGEIINDKIVYLRNKFNYNYVLPNPLQNFKRSFNKIKRLKE